MAPRAKTFMSRVRHHHTPTFNFLYKLNMGLKCCVPFVKWIGKPLIIVFGDAGRASKVGHLLKILQV